jgi:hypothetical protein
MIHFTVRLTASTPCNLNGTQLLALTQQQGFRMPDMSNPQVPQQAAILFDGVIIGYDLSQLAGNDVHDAVARGCSIQRMSPRSCLQLADGSKRVTVDFRKKNKRWRAQQPTFRGIHFPRKLLRIRAF